MHQAASNLVEFNLVPFQLCYLEILKIFKIFQPHISKIFDCINQFELKLIKQGTKLMSSIMYNPKSLEYSTYAKEYYQYSNALTSSQWLNSIMFNLAALFCQNLPPARRDAMTPLLVRKRCHYLFGAARGIETKKQQTLVDSIFQNASRRITELASRAQL